MNFSKKLKQTSVSSIISTIIFKGFTDLNVPDIIILDEHSQIYSAIYLNATNVNT